MMQGLNCTPFWSFAGHLTISLKIILMECKSIFFSHNVLLTMMCAPVSFVDMSEDTGRALEKKGG
jgi:hypothetical protein